MTVSTFENMNIYVILVVLALVFIGEQTTAYRIKKCPPKTTLASFNAAILPLFVGVNGTAEIEERTALLIKQVYIATPIAILLTF